MKNTWTKLLTANGFTPTNLYNCKEIPGIIHCNSREKDELKSVLSGFIEAARNAPFEGNPYQKDYVFFGDTPKKPNIFVSVKILDNDRCCIEMDAQDWLSLIKKTQFVNKKFCKWCESPNLSPHGKTYKSRKRYLCKDCLKTYVALY